MTKIEAFKQAKAIAVRIREAVEHTLGRDSSRNDKHNFGVYFRQLSSEQFQPMVLHIECVHGYYGCSSGYSDTSPELGQYLAKSIQHHGAMLLDYAVKLADEDAEKARKAAEDEARAVLDTTAA